MESLYTLTIPNNEYLEIVEVTKEKLQSYDYKVILKLNRGKDEYLFKIKHPYIPDGIEYFTCYLDVLTIDILAYAVGPKARIQYKSSFRYNDENDGVIAFLRKVLKPLAQQIKTKIRNQ